MRLVEPHSAFVTSAGSLSFTFLGVALSIRGAGGRSDRGPQARRGRRSSPKARRWREFVSCTSNAKRPAAFPGGWTPAYFNPRRCLNRWLIYGLALMNIRYWCSGSPLADATLRQGRAFSGDYHERAPCVRHANFALSAATRHRLADAKRLRLPFGQRPRQAEDGKVTSVLSAARPLSWRETGERVSDLREPHAFCVADCATGSLKDLQQRRPCGGASVDCQVGRLSSPSLAGASLIPARPEPHRANLEPRVDGAPRPVRYALVIGHRGHVAQPLAPRDRAVWRAGGRAFGRSGYPFAASARRLTQRTTPPFRRRLAGFSQAVKRGSIGGT